MKKLVYFSFGTAILVLTACSSFQQTGKIPSPVSPTQTVPYLTEQTAKPSDISLPNPTVTSKVSVVPTQTWEERFPSLLLLDIFTCDLPCHLGITPGVTTEEEACEIFLQLEPWFVDSLDGSCQINRIIRFGEFKYFYWIDIETHNGVVQSMRFAVNVQLGSLVNRYFSNLLLDKVFLSLGFPDEILVDPREDIYGTYEMLLSYPDKGIKYNLGASRDETGKICAHPQAKDNEEISIFIHAGISSPGTEMVEPIYLVEPYPSYVTVEEVFGITDQEFYEQVLANPEACFEIILD